MKTVDEELREVFNEVGLKYEGGWAWNPSNRNHGGISPVRISFENRNEVISFGKHKGRTWSWAISNAQDYLFWGLKNGVFAMDAELVIRASGNKSQARREWVSQSFHHDQRYEDSLT